MKKNTIGILDVDIPFYEVPPVNLSELEKKTESACLVMHGDGAVCENKPLEFANKCTCAGNIRDILGDIPWVEE